MCRSCNGGGVLNAEPLSVEIINPPGPITVYVNDPVPFEAIAYTADRTDFVSSPIWAWKFGDGDESAKNPTEHAYAKEGVYTVTVTATAKEGTGTAEMTVEVVGDDGGGDALLGDSLYLRDPITLATVGADGVCDGLQVVFETTDSMAMGPQLYRQRPPDVPTNTWWSMGTGTYEATGIPGLRRWVWGWPTWEKNWPVSFKVTYMRPGTPPPYPPPMVQITVGPVTWTPNNTAVHSGDEILPWNGTDPVTIPWTITHANRNNPTFTVYVNIYAVGSTTPVKALVLTGKGIGAGSVQWSGETDLGQPPGSQVAEPGIYKYMVSAIHDGWSECLNGDKSGQLTISNVTLSDFEWIPDTHPPQAKVWLEWDLSIDAEFCRLEVYAPCLNEVPVIDPADKELAPTGGHHFRWITFQVCPAHMGDYTFALFADETATTGQNNRDLLPKHALQSGAVLPVWPPAYGGAGVEGDISGWFEDPSALGAVQSAAARWNETRLDGTRYTGTSGQGPEEALNVYERLRDCAIVYTVSHANSQMVSFDNGHGSQMYDIVDDGPSHPENWVFSLEEIPAGGMAQCLFVFYHGCETAKDGGGGHRYLIDRTLAKGATAAAGFEGGPNNNFRAYYSNMFWDAAMTPGATVADAHTAGLIYVQTLFLGSWEYETFYTTNWGLSLHPARFGSPAP